MSKWELGELQVGDRFKYKGVEAIVTGDNGSLVPAVILEGSLGQSGEGEPLHIKKETTVTKIDKYGIVIPKQSVTRISFQEAVEKILDGKSVKYTNNKGLSIEVGQTTSFRTLLKVADDFYDLDERGRWYF